METSRTSKGRLCRVVELCSFKEHIASIFRVEESRNSRQRYSPEDCALLIQRRHNFSSVVWVLPTDWATDYLA
jgi:hypothetical protein